MPFVYSPSNMQTFRDCPLRFWGQSISKEIKWKASGSKSRGQTIHTAIQRRLHYGWSDDVSWDATIDVDFVRDCVGEVRRLMSQGAALYTEHELVLNANGGKTGWWDDDARIRARADALVLPADAAEPALLIDIKTGKKWDIDDFQLRVECLLTHILYQRAAVRYAYWYVDSGEEVDGIIDFRNGLAPVQDVLELLGTMEQALKNNHFPPTANKFCRWCDFNNTPKCMR